MTWFTKTLATVLLMSSGKTVHGQNACLSLTGTRCAPGRTDVRFHSCGLTDDDVLDMNSCLDAIGRSGIEVLDFGTNRLTKIPCDFLKDMNSLVNLWLDTNSITTIEEGALQQVASTLEFLSLSRNALETLPANRFAGMGKMNTLFFSYNQINRLPADAFVGLTGLQRLSLFRNELTTLPAGLFDDVGSVEITRSLDLGANPDLQCIPAVSVSGEWYDDSYAGYYITPLPTTAGMCECTSAVTCSDGVACTPGALGYTCDEIPPTACMDDSDCDTTVGEVCSPFLDVCGVPEANACEYLKRDCPPGVDVCDDPHMQGLRGQMIDWSGVDGGWYCLVTDNNANLHINVRLTAPLPEGFPDRQLITGLSVVSEGHSLTIEVANAYNVDTDGCPPEISPCLANGGLRAIVDGKKVDGLLRPASHINVVDGIVVSASNLPVECREFGGDTVWARMYDEMLQGTRQLGGEESFDDWVLSFDRMAAVDWCRKYIAQHSLADVQSNHAIFKIATSSVTVRLNVGTNVQGHGDLDWDGRVLPDLEFWQMGVGLSGLSIESESLSGILGETARPVLDRKGREVMKGYEAFRGTVEDYRVSGPLGTDFALLNKK